MSTVCKTASNAVSEAKSGAPAGTFETRDFFLACFLRCVGFDLADMHREGYRRVFVFRDRPGRRGDMMAFYNNAASAPPLTFASVIKDMKALIHNA